MLSISATIITFNEADRIHETISSLAFCEEIIVIDSYSTDETVQVARAAGARVTLRPWNSYSDQKNFAATQARHDWIFSVDADERPSAELAAEIMRWKQEAEVSDVHGLSMPRRASYCGRWINHSGWYPDRKTRLYDKRFAQWEGEFVHERLLVEGDVKLLGGDLLHFPYRSVEDHHKRIDKYTRLAADQARHSGRHFNPARLFIAPLFFFIKTLILQRGFLDGLAGLQIAFMGARYVFLKEFRILR